MKCENCGIEHDGSYGSGRFCSAHCRRQWIGRKSHRTAVERGTFKSGFSNPSNKRRTLGNWKCPICGEVLETKRKLKKHKVEEHSLLQTQAGPHNKGGIAWNKGKTAKDDPRMAKQVLTRKENHASGKVIPNWLGKHHTEETKRKLSEAMKKAHAEGRAHNIGECRWNNEHSWPEKWFIQVIENEFEDKNYKCEVPFHRFSLDFAWINKKKCIEIDGGWHETEEQKARDREKDRLLEEDGWQLLRMPWKEVYRETQKWIEKAKIFVDS